MNALGLNFNEFHDVNILIENQKRLTMLQFITGRGDEKSLLRFFPREIVAKIVVLKLDLDQQEKKKIQAISCALEIIKELANTKC